MTGFGPTLASSLAGTSQAERARVQQGSREDRDRAKARATRNEERDAPVDKVELTDAVRNLKDNSQEETREDREEHRNYRTDSGASARRPRLDLEG